MQQMAEIPRALGFTDNQIQDALAQSVVVSQGPEGEQQVLNPFSSMGISDQDYVEMLQGIAMEKEGKRGLEVVRGEGTARFQEGELAVSPLPFLLHFVWTTAMLPSLLGVRTDFVLLFPQSLDNKRSSPYHSFLFPLRVLLLYYHPTRLSPSTSTLLHPFQPPPRLFFLTFPLFVPLSFSISCLSLLPSTSCSTDCRFAPLETLRRCRPPCFLPALRRKGRKSSPLSSFVLSLFSHLEAPPSPPPLVLVARFRDSRSNHGRYPTPRGCPPSVSPPSSSPTSPH
jgi:hypothetical protein